MSGAPHSERAGNSLTVGRSVNRGGDGGREHVIYQDSCASSVLPRDASHEFALGPMPGSYGVVGLKDGAASRHCKPRRRTRPSGRRIRSIIMSRSIKSNHIPYAPQQSFNGLEERRRNR